MLAVINGSVDDEIMKLPAMNCIIMDPPDNLGLEYDGYVDRIPPEQYYQWVVKLASLAAQLSPAVWLSYYHTHDFEIKRRLYPFLEKNGYEARTFVWTYTFGQNRDTDCGSGYRPILRISPKNFQWYAADIKVPSWREENGDNRAAPGGRVPLDVWDFPRVTGNGPERCAWHPTQHPEALYIRMLKMSGALRVRPFRCVDLFGGTGTLLRSARQLQAKNPDLRAAVIEQSAAYCQAIRAQGFVEDASW